MTPEKPLIQYGAPAVGEGNRLVLACLAKELSADYALVDTSQTISSIPAQIWHRRMTNSVSSYNESMRNSPLSMALGYCLAIEGAIRQGNKKPRMGIFTQEMQLTPLAQNPQLLPRFYDHLFLLIPDTMPKHNSIDIMQKLSCHLTPVVWNHDAESELKQYGLNPLLTAPFLSPLSAANITAEKIST